MSWNYRIFRHATKHGDAFALHEAYYDGEKEVDGYTTNAVSQFADDPDELIRILEHQLADARRFKGEVLDYKE